MSSAPGYTHTQRAQPVLLAHHLMAYYEMLTRDRGRLKDGLVRVNVMPLGSAALAGSTFDNRSRDGGRGNWGSPRSAATAWMR